MAKLLDIKNAIIKLFPDNALNDTTWEYGFKFNNWRAYKNRNHRSWKFCK